MLAFGLKRSDFFSRFASKRGAVTSPATFHEASPPIHVCLSICPLRAKSRALVRAHQLLEEGDAEVANLSKQAVALDEECNRIQSLIGELEVTLRRVF